MMDPQTHRRKKHRQWICPAMMLIVAGILAAAFGLCHVFGMREGISVLFSTSYSPSAARNVSAYVYVGLYLGFVTVTPILALAAGIFGILQLAMRRLRKTAAG